MPNNLAKMEMVKMQQLTNKFYLQRIHTLIDSQPNVENLATCTGCGESYSAERKFYLSFNHFLEAHQAHGGIIV